VVLESAHPGRGSPLGWLTPLVGREVELDALAQLLDRHRLVTLTGAGGVGKTRLALELASRWPGAHGDADARTVVELAMLESSDGKPNALEPIARAIRRALQTAARGPATRTGAPLEDVVRHFGERPALLVLDNCEHLPAVAAVSESLLRRCPLLRILATSRRALVLPGETVSQVPPLSLPGPAGDPLMAVRESEAGRLFIERAQRSLPSFSLTADSAPAVAEICRRLDGLPLAIELAAARVAILSPAQILDGLDDRFVLLAAGPASSLGRHRTLRASLEWSYELIDADAQALLRLLSAAPEWSLEAIVATRGDDQPVLDALSSLLDAGLLATVEAGELRRYRLLESVRSYARERLRAAGEEGSVQRAHLEHFTALAADANRLLADDAGRRRLESEAESLFAALQFAVAEQPALALQMTADLRHWLPVSGRSADALSLCASVLAAAPPSDAAARSYVLHTAAQLAIFAEDYTRARAYAQEALPLARSSGDDGALGSGLVLAAVGQRASDPAASAELGRQAVALLRGAGDRQDLALAVAQLALTEALRDRFGAARELSEELGALLGGRPPSWLAPWIEVTIAWADLGQGNPRSALEHCERALELEDGRSSTAYYTALSYKLHAMVLTGEAGRARAIGTAEVNEAERVGLGVAVAGLEFAVALAELALEEYGPARDLAMRRFGDPHFAVAANAHELLARLELAERRPDPLRRHAAALRATGQHTGNPRLQALAGWADGTAALLTGELTEAANRLDEALSLQVEHRLRPGAIDTLEAIGELQLARGRAGAAARLLGAAEHARSELELCRLPARPTHFQQLRERGTHAAGDEPWAQALAEGRELTLEAALDYAHRGRGRRVTSPAGVGSLTPAELSVAEAAADGLTNAAIATRLFMSRGTVKAHLAHAYQKLEVANRVELAALVREHPR
jgi:predicted ATPase/DNA-binding CsgD family transcriptional regulator